MQLNPEFMWSYFIHKDMPCNLRKGPTLSLPKTHSFFYGTNAVHFHGSLIWNNIKNIGDIDCRCLICRDM